MVLVFLVNIWGLFFGRNSLLRCQLFPFFHLQWPEHAIGFFVNAAGFVTKGPKLTPGFDLSAFNILLNPIKIW